MIIESMAQAGAEPTFCMGDDTPLPVLSSKPHMLSDYFKQRFAQARTWVPLLRNRFDPEAPMTADTLWKYRRLWLCEAVAKLVTRCLAHSMPRWWGMSTLSLDIRKAR